MQEILKETIKFYQKNGLLDGIKIKKILLTYPDTVIYLSNGKFATAANYDYNNLGPNRLQKLERLLNQLIQQDKLSINYVLNKRANNLLWISIKIALLNAVSQAYLNNEYLKNLNFKVTSYNELELSKDIIKAGDICCVVGFGGWLFNFLKNNLVQKVYCSDLYHNKINAPDVKLSLNDNGISADLIQSKLILGGENKTKEFIEAADIAFITACALNNNSMEKLLNYAKNTREIIVSGHSASLIPVSFYNRGVNLFLTKLFTKDFLDERQSMSADEFRRLVDTKNLPVVIKKYD